MRLASPGRNQNNSERGINEATERTSGEGDRPRCAGIMGLARTCLDVENPLGGYLAAHVLTNRFAFRRRRRSRKGLRSCRLRESTRRHARPMRDLHASNKPCSITSRNKFKLWLKLRNPVDQLLTFPRLPRWPGTSCAEFRGSRDDRVIGVRLGTLPMAMAFDD